MFRRSWALAALLVLLLCGTAAGAPVTVQLRVEGATTTLFEGSVTTDGHAVDGGDGTGLHPCDGTNLGANPSPGPTMTSALDDGVGRGGWHGPWDPGFEDFLVDKIGAESSTSFTNYWGSVLNFQPALKGGCQIQVQTGDEVLFALGDIFGQQLLRLAGPARAKIGDTASVTVTDGKTGTAVEGATVAGANTGVDGTASVTFGSSGLVSLKAAKAGAIRSNAVNVCVSDTGTGDCGVPPSALGGGGGPAVKDSRAPVARISGPRDGQTYRRGPRLLSGVASDAETGVTEVKLAFRRHLRGHCSWWSGRREQFVGSNCHKKFFFSIGHDARWSYLLPHSLPPGRYVLDAKAFDRARNRDEHFERGRNRVVFYVSGAHRSSGARSARSRAPVVQAMIAGKALQRTGLVRARAQVVRVSGRSCKVGARTPLAVLAALLRDAGAAYRLRDYGHCSRTNPNDSSQLFVVRIGSERNRGNNGWFYKVNDRAPEVGAGDTSGRPVRSGDRVLWFYCVFDDGERSCQRSLRVEPAPEAAVGRPLRVRVRGYDNQGRSVTVAGATVTLGTATALSGDDGIAQVVPVGKGGTTLAAAKDGLVRSFPLAIDVK